MTSSEVLNSIDFQFYASTQGCYIIADEFNNLVVCHRCKKENPMKIDLSGDDLYIRFLTGDMVYLLDFCQNVDHIVFERLHDPENYKVYKFEKIRERVIGTLSSVV